MELNKRHKGLFIMGIGTASSLVPKEKEGILVFLDGDDEMLTKLRIHGVAFFVEGKMPGETVKIYKV